MSNADRERWEERYRTRRYGGRTEPSELLATFADRLPSGRALDLACGTGRNALFLARRGYAVDAVDISPTALASLRSAAADEGLRVRCIEADLEALQVPAHRYDVIVLVRYTNRALFGLLARHLNPGGHAVVEEHLTTSATVAGPGSSRFRVAPNELLRAAGDLRVLHYSEAVVEGGHGERRALARLVACSGSPGY